MNFDEAMIAHSAWKVKLASYLRVPDGTLKADVVGNDALCQLGQWILRDGSTQASNPKFVTLKAEHQRFHMAAAEVVRRADRGENVTEDFALGSKSEFGIASGRVLLSLMALKRESKGT